MSYLANDPSFASRSIHGGQDPDTFQDRAIAAPIVLATKFKQSPPITTDGVYVYSRFSSPTRSQLEECLASLENMKYCLTFSSGQAAVATMLSRMRPGDHVITQTDIYHGVFNLMKDAKQKGVKVDFLDLSLELEIEKLQSLVTTATRLVWLETPTNPLMKVIDIQKVVGIVRSKNSNAIIVCDNTFLSPFFQRPATFGVDVVMHSCTKYLGGHSDVLMGALCMSDKSLYQELLSERSLYGPSPSSFDCYLMMRSLKTLEVRMEKHMSNAIRLASFIEKHRAVERVCHPGLPSHQHYELSQRQCYGHSGMFSFYLKGHNAEDTWKFVNKLKMTHLADSLGSTETILKVPSFMPPNSLTPEEYKSQGITDGLVRVSTGIESIQDLIADFIPALNAIEQDETVISDLSIS